MTEPNLFALPLGVDFPAELVEGLLARMAGQPPEALARVTVIVNTQRMRRRVAEGLQAKGALLLPRLMLITEAATLAGIALPRPISSLRRRLELSVLLDGLLATGSTQFPRTALYDLADSLAALMEEMQGEGVDPGRIARLDVANHSAHWARTQAFLGIVTEALRGEAPDAEAVLRRAVTRLAEEWSTSPPADPVILAGSTASRGTTALLVQAIARLPNGAVVLPGYDFDTPDPVWASMDDALTAEDHPQFRFRRVMDLLECGPGAIRRWTEAQPPAPDRNRLISLSLRPAPITDQWLTEGPGLPDLRPATEALILIEAPSERAEAIAIALILREAAETGTRAALVSPDRNLTRRVTAALDRWGIRPDDSAGRPLALSAPGRLMRQVAALFGQKLTGDALLALLKHPLAFSGPGRGPHLILTREFELHLRRHGPAFPTAESVQSWADTQTHERAADWARIVAATLCGHEAIPRLPLEDFVAMHLVLSEALARGFAETGAGALWEKAAGEEAAKAVAELQAEAGAGGEMTPADYAGVFLGVLNRHEVRETESVHPGIMIWGTLEARVQGADLVVLGGLNDGTWPAQPSPDPWLNRAMRKEAGLLLPERRIGLSAHDYQQAVAARRVVLSRAKRGPEAETVPSRWLNRLVNLMSGLAERNGPDALRAMRDRGEGWLRQAQAFDAAPAAALAPPAGRGPAAEAVRHRNQDADPRPLCDLRAPCAEAEAARPAAPRRRPPVARHGAARNPGDLPARRWRRARKASGDHRGSAGRKGGLASGPDDLASPYRQGGGCLPGLLGLDRGPAGADRGKGRGGAAGPRLHADRQARPDRPVAGRAALSDRLQDRRATHQGAAEAFRQAAVPDCRDGRGGRVPGAGPRRGGAAFLCRAEGPAGHRDDRP